MGSAGEIISGRVAAFDPHVGLGTVVDEQGERWMFHCTTIADGSRSIDVDTPVEFRIGPGGPGRWEALIVRPAAKTNAWAPPVG